MNKLTIYRFWEEGLGILSGFYWEDPEEYSIVVKNNANGTGTFDTGSNLQDVNNLTWSKGELNEYLRHALIYAGEVEVVNEGLPSELRELLQEWRERA